MGNGTTAYYQIDDALGSTRLVTLSNAATYFSSDYQPYGANYAQAGSEEFMYTGKMLDSLSGLYYFAARFYDAATGRFISEDSNTGGQDDPLSLNHCVYARDNPMRFGRATIVNQTASGSTLVITIMQATIRAPTSQVTKSTATLTVTVSHAQILNGGGRPPQLRRPTPQTGF